MFCIRCGVENDVGARFCFSCGARVWSEASAELPDPDLPEPERSTPISTVEDIPEPPPNHDWAAHRSTEAPPRSGSYISRHWRGDLTLPKSYWINVVLVGFVAVAIASLVGNSGNWSNSIWPILFVVLTVWAFVFLLTAWQLVGTWRSATKHPSRGGSRGWAIVAKGLLVIGAIQALVAGTGQAAPQIAELVKIVIGQDPVGAWQIRVLRNASEVEVSGAIGFGLAEELIRVLDAHPSVALVHLNSHGGRIAEARQIRDVIEERRLSTYTATECLSACTVAFIAGRERLIGANARLGFHSYAFPGLRSEDFASEMADDRDDFVRRGVDAGFAQRAFRNSSEFWYPKSQELIESGVATRVPDISEVGISGISVNDEDVIDRQLRSSVLFAALSDHHADVYEKIVAEYKLAIQRGDSMAELRSRTLPLVMATVTERLAFASDSAVLAYVELFLEQVRILYDKDPSKCHAYLLGKEPASFLADLSATLDREFQVEADVIRTAASGLGTAPEESVVAADFERLQVSLVRWFGSDLDALAAPEAPGVDPKKYCEMAYALYSEAIDLPPPRAAHLLKFIFASN